MFPFYRNLFYFIIVAYIASSPIFGQTQNSIIESQESISRTKNLNELSDIELMELPKWSVILGGGQSIFGLNYKISLATQNTELRNSIQLFRFWGAEPNQEIRNLSFLSMSEHFRTREWRVTSSRYFLSFEYLIDWRRIFGFDITLNHTNNQLRCTVSCGEIGNLYRLYSLQDVTSFGAIAPSVDLLFGNLPVENGNRHYKYTTIDPGFVFHVLAESKIDPYLGFNIGIGKCSFKEERSSTQCQVYRLGSRVGFRFHYSKGMFAQLQVERANVYFSLNEQVESFSLGALWPVKIVNETITTFGIGMRL